MSDKSFRVSPLLADAAKEVFAGERLRELHISVARAFAEGWMSPQEGAQAFEHAWEAKLILALRGMVESLFSESRAVFDAVSAQVSWFIAEGLKEGEVLLPNDRHVSLLLRVFLLRIAAGNLPALAFPALRAWRAEIEQGEPQARPSARYLLAIEALGHGEIVLSAKDAVEYLGMLFDLGAGDADLRAMADEQMANVPPNIAREMRHESPAGLQAVLSFNRCRSVAWLDDGLTALEAASPALRENILHAARLNSWWCGMMIDATWLDEEAKVQPDWPRCLAVLPAFFISGSGPPPPASPPIAPQSLGREVFHLHWKCRKRPLDAGGAFTPGRKNARGIDPLEQMDFKIFSTRNCRAGTVAANTWLFTRIPGGTAGNAMWLRRALCDEQFGGNDIWIRCRRRSV